MRKKGGFKAAIASGLTLVLLIGALMAVVRNNDIKDAAGLYDYFRSWSDKIWECSEGDLEWRCSIDGTNNGGGTTPPTSSSKPTESPTSDSGDIGDTSTPNPSTEPTSSTVEPTNTAPENPTELLTVYQQKLENLNISERQEVDYVRSDWRHWTGSPCNTREEILKLQGTGVETDSECRATAGTWLDPYSENTFTEAGDLDIDHLIPLSYAASQGGNDWNKEMKQQFANDHIHLLAVSARENRSKGDKGPGEYMPPSKSSHCEYAKIWIDTSEKYSLSIESSDKKALEKALKTCSA